MCADGIQEMAVVAHDDDKAVVLVVQDEIFQPVDGLNVEVVRRLVEEDNVRLTEQGLCQQDLDLDTAVGVGHTVVVQLHGHTEALQNAAGIGLGLPAVQLCELRLQLRSQQAVLIGKIRLGIQSVLLFHDIIQALVAHNDRVEDGIGIVTELVLLQDGHAQARLDGDRALRGVQLAREQLQECGLARTVCADHTIAIAGGKLQIDMLEQERSAILQRKIADRNHWNHLGNSVPQILQKRKCKKIVTALAKHGKAAIIGFSTQAPRVPIRNKEVDPYGKETVSGRIETPAGPDDQFDLYTPRDLPARADLQRLRCHRQAGLSGPDGRHRRPEPQ